MKSVRFTHQVEKPSIQVLEINNYESYENEKNLMWYNKTEINKFRNDVLDIRRKRLRQSTNRQDSYIDEADEYFLLLYFYLIKKYINERGENIIRTG